MAVVNNELPTLLDQVKRQAPNGAIDRIVEQLTRKNPILEDMVVLEGNLPTGHRVTSRTGLPSVGWRKLNEGVAPSKSVTDQFDEACGELAGMSVVDTRVAKLNGNEAAFRASEDKAFVAAMSNEIATGIFYHSTDAAPEKFNGLAPRYDNTVVSAANPQGDQIIKCDPAAAGADQYSIWLVVWGPETVFGIYPKGSVAGLEPDDRGVQLWNDANNKKFKAYVTYWTWDFGLVVRDWRYVVRIGNIDASGFDATKTLIHDAMADAVEQVQDLNSGRPVLYCSRKVKTMLRKEARNAVKSSTLTTEMVGGKPVDFFDGIPIKRSDALVTEDVIA